MACEILSMPGTAVYNSIEGHHITFKFTPDGGASLCLWYAVGGCRHIPLSPEEFRGLAAALSHRAQLRVPSSPRQVEE